MRVNGKKALICNELICHWKFNAGLVVCVPSQITKLSSVAGHLSANVDVLNTPTVSCLASLILTSYDHKQKTVPLQSLHFPVKL